MQTTANIAEGGDGRMKRQVRGQTMAMNGTVYDRMKQTGYVMSPNHMMGPAMDQAGAPGATGDSDGAPPNLRDSTDPESCGNCANYEAAGENGGGNCSLYSYSVTPNQVCDSYESEAGGDGDEPGMAGAGMGGMMGPSE